jgi:hypothetical protein
MHAHARLQRALPPLQPLAASRPRAQGLRHRHVVALLALVMPLLLLSQLLSRRPCPLLLQQPGHVLLVGSRHPHRSQAQTQLRWWLQLLSGSLLPPLLLLLL